MTAVLRRVADGTEFLERPVVLTGLVVFCAFLVVMTLWVSCDPTVMDFGFWSGPAMGGPLGLAVPCPGGGESGMYRTAEPLFELVRYGLFLVLIGLLYGASARAVLCSGHQVKVVWRRVGYAAFALFGLVLALAAAAVLFGMVRVVMGWVAGGGG